MAQLGGPGSEFLMRLQSSCWLELQSSESLAGAGGATFKLTHEAIDKGFSFSPCRLLYVAAHNTAAGLPKWVTKEQENISNMEATVSFIT